MLGKVLAYSHASVTGYGEERGNSMKLKRPEYRKVLSSTLIGTFALLWWGVLYPELCFPEATYEIVNDQDEDVNHAKNKDAKKTSLPLDGESCYGMLDADEGQIIVSSRLLEWLKHYQKE